MFKPIYIIEMEDKPKNMSRMRDFFNKKMIFNDSFWIFEVLNL